MTARVSSVLALSIAVWLGLTGDARVQPHDPIVAAVDAAEDLVASLCNDAWSARDDKALDAIRRRLDAGKGYSSERLTTARLDLGAHTAKVQKAELERDTLESKLTGLKTRRRDVLAEITRVEAARKEIDAVVNPYSNDLAILKAAKLNPSDFLVDGAYDGRRHRRTGFSGWLQRVVGGDRSATMSPNNAPIVDMVKVAVRMIEAFGNIRAHFPGEGLSDWRDNGMIDRVVVDARATLMNNLISYLSSKGVDAAAAEPGAKSQGLNANELDALRKGEKDLVNLRVDIAGLIRDRLELERDVRVSGNLNALMAEADQRVTACIAAQREALGLGGGSGGKPKGGRPATDGAVAPATPPDGSTGDNSLDGVLIYSCAGQDDQATRIRLTRGGPERSRFTIRKGPSGGSESYGGEFVQMDDQLAGLAAGGTGPGDGDIPKIYVGAVALRADGRMTEAEGLFCQNTGPTAVQGGLECRGVWWAPAPPGSDRPPGRFPKTASCDNPFGGTTR